MLYVRQVDKFKVWISDTSDNTCECVSHGELLRAVRQGLKVCGCDGRDIHNVSEEILSSYRTKCLMLYGFNSDNNKFERILSGGNMILSNFDLCNSRLDVRFSLGQEKSDFRIILNNFDIENTKYFVMSCWEQYLKMDISSVTDVDSFKLILKNLIGSRRRYDNSVIDSIVGNDKMKWACILEHNMKDGFDIPDVKKNLIKDSTNKLYLELLIEQIGSLSSDLWLDTISWSSNSILLVRAARQVLDFSNSYDEFMRHIKGMRTKTLRKLCTDCMSVSRVIGFVLWFFAVGGRSEILFNNIQKVFQYIWTGHADYNRR